MPIKHAFNHWECKYCHKDFKLELMALGCELSHDIIYVPLKKEDLKNLVFFIQTRNEVYLTNSLIDSLLPYSYNMSGTER